MGRTLCAEGKEGAELHTFGTKCHGCQHGFAASDASRCNEWQACGTPYLRNQSHGCQFFAPIVAAGFKAFRHHSIHTRLFAFRSKAAARHYMGHLDAGIVETGSILLRTASRGKYHLYAAFYNQVDDLFYLRVHQGEVYTPCAVGMFVHAVDVVGQGFGVHAACSQQSQSAGVADR